MPTWKLVGATISCCLALGVFSAYAQEMGEAVMLPKDPTQWINSGPISPQSLKGKAVLLWYFEESCPTCRGKWPKLLAFAKQYEGRPIVFIAVNSGNPRPVVEQYLRDVGCTWPTIVDPTRAFEMWSDVGEISLENIHQVKTITPQGIMGGGDWANLEETANRLLIDAKWNVDPAGIPASLKPAWSAIEFGDLATGAPAVKKALNSNKPEIRQGADRLNTFVKSQLDTALEEAIKTKKDPNHWTTYRAYQQLADRFVGYPIPEEVATTLKDLSSDEKVKEELLLLKQLAIAKKSLQSTNRSARAGAVNRLKKLLADSPQSQAGQEASELLKQITN